MIEIAANVAAALGRGGGGGRPVLPAHRRPRSRPRVFEINARFGGGYPLADQAGGRFAESLLARVAGLPECASDHWREGVTMVRYDSAVFRG